MCFMCKLSYYLFAAMYCTRYISCNVFTFVVAQTCGLFNLVCAFMLSNSKSVNEKVRVRVGCSATAIED